MPGPSSPWPVAIPTELFRPTVCNKRPCYIDTREECGWMYWYRIGEHLSASWACSHIGEKRLLASSCPSVRTYHWTDFRKIWYWWLLWKIVEKNSKFCQKFGRNIVRFTCRCCCRRHWKPYSRAVGVVWCQAVQYSRGGISTTRTRHNVTLYVVCCICILLHEVHKVNTTRSSCLTVWQ
jgi:hypothetical protein